MTDDLPSFDIALPFTIEPNQLRLAFGRREAPACEHPNCNASMWCPDCSEFVCVDCGRAITRRHWHSKRCPPCLEIRGRTR